MLHNPEEQENKGKSRYLCTYIHMFGFAYRIQIYSFIIKLVLEEFSDKDTNYHTFI